MAVRYAAKLESNCLVTAESPALRSPWNATDYNLLSIISSITLEITPGAPESKIATTEGLSHQLGYNGLAQLYITNKYSLDCYYNTIQKI